MDISIFCLLGDVEGSTLCLFGFLFQAAKLAGWLLSDDNLYRKASHVGFGLVLGDGGERFRTRSSEVVRLVDLLDTAKSQKEAVLIKRGMVSEYLFFNQLFVRALIQNFLFKSIVNMIFI